MRREETISRAVALLAALFVAVLGVVLLRMSSDREAVAAPERASGERETAQERAEASAESSVDEADARVEESAPSDGADTQQTPSEDTRADASEQQEKPVSAPTKPTVKAAPRAPKKAATRSLPPLPPPDWSMDSAALEEPSGPPPGVLWLSGVIQGDPRVAVLRRGEKRYVVREGDTIESTYRVAEIGTNSVTLERGRKKQTLRVGVY